MTMRRSWFPKRRRTNPQPIELRLPSQLGYEKVAMDTVAVVAARVGFEQEQIDGLRTAVSEAVTNAIEHGNSGLSHAEVHILMVIDNDRLVVSVRDQRFRKFDHSHGHERPDITRALSGEDVGWGMWLIRQFVDDVEWCAAPNGGNEVRMTLRCAPSA